MTDNKDSKDNKSKENLAKNLEDDQPAKPMKEQVKEEEKKDAEAKKIKKEVTRSFSSFLISIRTLLGDILDIREGSDPDKTRAAIVHDIEFRGANVWSLIASIFIASIGLNMNSTAVVIGAMLISPLMGPIIGLGYSIAINDLTLLIKSIKNFGVMVVLAIFTSTFYFWLSPLTAASAELIGRTQPTLLDLSVAVFGGIAGIVSISKSERTNVIPGVAIATALIPPLCTAGYGISEANWTFFFGASYLFLINSVFIAIASFVVIRYLRFPYKEHVDPKRDKKVKRVMIIFSIIVMIPSAYMFFGAIEKFNFESQSSMFINDVVVAPESKIIKTEFSFRRDSLSYIELYMIGEPIDSITIKEWTSKMDDYRLKNTELRIFQDKDIKQEYIAMDDLEKNVKTGIIEELYQQNKQALTNKDRKIELLENELSKYREHDVPFIKIDNEIRKLEPYISTISLGENFYRNDSNRVDTVYSLMITWDKKMNRNKKKKKEMGEKLGQWLEVRLDKDSVLVVNLN